MTQRIIQLRIVRFGVARFGRALLALTILAGAVSFPTAQAQVNDLHLKRKDQYKHQVEKLEQAWREAELAGDADSMAKLLSDDYVGITMSGQVVTKTQQLDRLRSRRTTLTRIDLSDVHVKLVGMTMTAIVTSLAEVEGTSNGTPIHGIFRYTRVYSRTASGTWKITNFEATRVGPPPPPPNDAPPHDDGQKPE
jgi:ketosteroid isomerase-like protein